VINGDRSMKMLYIKSCDDERKWYANKVGSLVPYLEDYNSSYEYKSLQDNGIAPGHRFTNFVSKQDADIVEIDE